MPEILKNRYSALLVKSIAADCKKYDEHFQKEFFIVDVISDDWESLELKDRMHRIADVLGKYLSQNYSDAINTILLVAKHYTGLVHMCFPDFVEKFGVDDHNNFEISMMALENLTEGCSSEFAIRPFIIKYPIETMDKMLQWSKSKSEHVRRLASEGCRPRLPWAMALSEFKKNPEQVIKIILPLMDDESLYVRRSVANNLNDISKDNPHYLLEIAEKNLGKRVKNKVEVDWVIKHACRGLLKQGNKKVLSLFGYTHTKHIKVNDFYVDEIVTLGGRLNFKFKLLTNKKPLGKLRIEFIIDFMKKNGKPAGKIFKVCEGHYLESEKIIKKHFSFKQISTRKYYLGQHAISIIINGEKIITKNFMVK
jgi:3-methyladenine DNA glycosylase AlkC